MRLGISIRRDIGLGDGLIYSSLPENYYFATGERLIDVSRPWFFDHNPFVDRESTPDEVREMWNFSPTQYKWPRPRFEERPQVYLSNAEIWASLFGVPTVLNRPRLYRFEGFPYKDRKKIIIHTAGVSHGEMPDHVIEHIKEKYASTGELYQIGTGRLARGIRHIETKTPWDLAEVISQAKLFIGMDSGPSWIACCYPDVVTKKLRMKPNPPEMLHDWIPLEIRNIHSHWDDRTHQVFNSTLRDIGFTYSYRRL